MHELAASRDPLSPCCARASSAPEAGGAPSAEAALPPTGGIPIVHLPCTLEMGSDRLLSRRGKRTGPHPLACPLALLPACKLTGLGSA